MFQEKGHLVLGHLDPFQSLHHKDDLSNLQAMTLLHSEMLMKNRRIFQRVLKGKPVAEKILNHFVQRSLGIGVIDGGFVVYDEYSPFLLHLLVDDLCMVCERFSDSLVHKFNVC